MTTLLGTRLLRRTMAACLPAAILFSLAAAAGAQPKDTIFDEAKVPDYVLPDPLLLQDGSKVADAETWQAKRRGEVLRLFEEHVQGRSPEAPKKIDFEVASVDDGALDGTATRKQVTVFPTGDRNGPTMNLLLYLPNAVDKPVPAFLGLNFYGNQTINADPGIAMSDRWMRPNGSSGTTRSKSP